MQPNRFIFRSNARNIGRGLKGVQKEVRAELDFYFGELGERDPWRYAIYHCSTLANVYSKVHWKYYTKRSED